MQNFFSVGNNPIEIFLDKSKNTLITGANGFGKSALLTDSIIFALYGKPYRKINLPQIVNSINKKGCLVEISFNKANDSYKVIRGIAPKIFEIYKNGVMLNQDSANRDYQQYLETHILGMNYRSFCQIVILSSSNYTPFMQLSLAERRNIIEDLLDIGVFSKMNSVLKEKYNTLKETKVALENTETILKEKISLKKGMIEFLSKKQDERIEEIQTNIDNFNSQIESIKSSIIEKESEISTIRNSILNLKHDEIKSTRDSITKKLNTLQSTIHSEKKNLNFFSVNEVCPTCTQSISEEFRNEKINYCKETITTHEETIDKIITAQQTLDSKLSIISNLQTDISVIQKSIDYDMIKISTLQENIQKCLYDKNKDTDIDTEKLHQELEELKNEYKENIIEYKKILKEKKVHEISLELLKDSGIKTKIIEKYIPVINKTIKQYLSLMGFYITYELNLEFEEKIRSMHQDRFSYSSFSEGEKSRIDLALLFTWREVAKLRNSAACNLLILDEVFDGSLDENARESLLNILESLTTTNVFVITHMGDFLFDKMHSHLQLEKISNFTRIS